MIEKIKGRLSKWKWLVPQMSYRGRVLVINNLAASSLWHKLACVDPPPNLLANLQAMLVDFFWDRLHWIPQGVLHLPKEEGGQGLVHLASRTAAFRLQFIQRLLAGPNELVWRAVSYTILHTVGGLGLDRALFLMSTKTLDIAGLPVFYRGLFKIWDFFKVNKQAGSALHWLLEEPLFNGARLDLAGTITPALTRVLLSSGVTTLRRLVDVAGPDLTRVEDVAARLGMRSLRVVAQLLEGWRTALSPEEREQVKDYSAGVVSPTEDDPFPDITITPDLQDCEGPLLESEGESGMNLGTVSGKLLYRACVKLLNKKRLRSRTDTPWRDVFNLSDDVKPEWRALYKPPLTKKVADLQWRILHGIVSVNAFISVLNPEILPQCPFCPQRETVFHAFMYCFRLCSLFEVLKNVFRSLNVTFTLQTFILGFKYVKREKSKCQLINFILGQAKMAIYISRKNKVAHGADYEATRILSRLVKSRILIDFNYYKSMSDVEAFEARWCCGGAVCSVCEGELCFAPELR